MMSVDLTPSTARSWTLGATLALCASTLAACAQPPRLPDTAVYASGADLESGNPLVTIHPLARQVQRYALFVTLVRYDAALSPAPYYAHAWSWSQGRRQLTLSLVSDLHWHDGAPTTARDVQFTLDAARDPLTGYPRYGDLATIDTVLVVNDSTVSIRFRQAPPELPLVLAELPILPAHHLAGIPRSEMRRAPFNLAPVGNGPFRFVERHAGARWVFERYDDFPRAMGGPPRLRRLVVAVVDEATTKFAGLVSGELDVAGISPTMAELTRSDPALRVESYPVLFSTAMIFNTRRPPFDVREVRHAIHLSLDRQRIVDAALAGFGTPADGPIPPANPLALSIPASRDTARADSLLDAAGWHRGPGRWRHREGRQLTFELLTVGGSDNALEQLVQADLAARGIRVRIRGMELGAFLSVARGREKRFDALITGIPGDLSGSYLAAMHESRLAGGALDYGGFHSPRLDSLFGRARAASHEQDVRRAWHEIQRELLREMPEVWVYHARGVQGIANRLRGVHMDLRGEMPTLAEWYIAGSPNAPATAQR